MKRSNPKSALVSLLFGIIALWLGTSRMPGRAVLAVPLGVLAAISGLGALWWIHRARVRSRAKGMALAGLALGLIGLISGVSFVRSLMVQGHQRERWQQEESARLQKAMEPGRPPERPMTNFTSNLPIVVLQTRGRYIDKESQTLIRAEFRDTGKKRASLDAAPDYAGLASIHLRGSSTLHLPKQSYTLHTLDGQTNQTKVSLLGLPAEADWVLYAPFEDKTMIRDVLAFQLFRKMGHYAPRTRYVELFLSASPDRVSMSDYQGVYVLVEKIKRGKERVNIAKLTREDRAEPEISGGYIVKRDHNDRAESRFHTSRGGPYFYVYPNAKEITPAQRNWLEKYFRQFEEALFGDDFKDPARGYAAYLDVPCFIDAHWLIELAKNVDGFRYSSFLTKDRGGKLRTEPPWDWNRAFGNANYYGGDQTHGWYWPRLRSNEISWYGRLKDDPAFLGKCAGRWVELRKHVFNPAEIDLQIDQLAAELAESQPRNFDRWRVLGMHVGSNAYVGGSYEDEIRFLKKWIKGRIEWIDGQIVSASNL